MSDGVVLRVVEFQPPGSAAAGPPILFVPGWISVVTGWIPVLSELTAHHRVIYIETREKVSAGIPRGPLPSFQMDRLVEDLHEIVEARLEPGERHVLMGSSLGSTLILDHMGRGAPSPVTSILIAPNAEFRLPAWVLPVARVVPGPAFIILRKVLKWYLTSFILDAEAEPEQAARYRRSLDEAEPRRLKANARAMARYAVWDCLGGIHCPVLIITGQSDALHHRGDMDRMVEMLPEGRIEVMASNRETHSAKAGQLALAEIAKYG
jgi:pimeloyl-ACP methyl ester carboxylesterase